VGYRAFNAGSPWNNSAGHSADLKAVEKYYELKHNEEEKERIARQENRQGSAYD
jgi:hypothetical protein